ncbi:unnamed protein product [Linum tenue]|uniref:Uncharacterized protein n=1 Tax=Linum tenue TaxID=586396 RepID=A0AAV0MBZ4_9ROSI|nr:unnamed protein product [Linum tenue]
MVLLAAQATRELQYSTCDRCSSQAPYPHKLAISAS